MAIGNEINKTYQWTDTNGKKYSVDPASAGGFMKAYNTYATDRKAQFNADTKYLDNTLKQNNATTNSNYDNSARQAYVDYMRKQKALPSQLQALGVNGGATESGLLNLYNNYGSTHAANEQQRNADLTTNQNNRNDAYNTLRSTYQSDLNAQKQTALNNQINEYNNEITRFSSTVAQYPTTTAGYKSYQKWIENMSKSNDPLKDIKVAMIRQQMATQFADGTTGSKSGGGGGRSYSRGGYGSSRSSSSPAADATNAAVNNVMNGVYSSLGKLKGLSGSPTRNAYKNVAKRGTRPWGYAQ